MAKPTTFRKWLTYDEAAERLGISAEAVRSRARRNKWRRKRADDGRILLRLPDDANGGEESEQAAAIGGRTTALTTLDKCLIATLEGLVRILREELALLRAELHAVRADLAAERRSAREAALVYLRIAEEVVALRKARETAAPSLAARLAELQKSRATVCARPSAPPAFDRIERENTLAAIRRQIEESLLTRH